MSPNKFLSWSLGIFLLCASGWLVGDRAQARGTGPDTSGRGIPYRGHLERDGVAVSSQAVPMTFVVRGVFPNNAQQTWSYGPVNVDVFSGEFSVLIGENAAVPDWVYAAQQAYVRVTVNGVALAGEQRIHPVPYATWSAESRDLLVESSLRVNGPIQAASLSTTGDIANSNADGQLAPSSSFALRDTGDQWLRLRTGLGSNTYADFAVGQLVASRYMPDYSTWGATTGAGGAAIVNDNVGYKALMIVGNNSANDARRVKLFDDVFVDRNLSVTGSVCNGGYCGRPFITCTWSGERSVFGDQGCEDDIHITCTGGIVTNMRFSC